ncbi:MAG: hypothetical protein ACT6SC_09770, partial [Blastomonas fulva]
VLAPTAAMADAAATVIANAIDLPGHPAVERLPASSIQSDSDLGERLVTRDVGPLATDDIETALAAYRDRRFERCRYIVDSSKAICFGQIGKGPLVDNATATREMFMKVAEPI